MKQRILAWVLLIGFIALFIDIAYIGFMRPLFASVYVILALAFVFVGNRNKNV